MNSEIPKVFISSVCGEFERHRLVLAAMIKSCGYNPIYSESPDFTLYSRLSPSDNCLANVEKSHIFLLVLGEEYGTIVNNSISIVEKEYQTAKENNLHIVVCVSKPAWEKFWLWKADSVEKSSKSQIAQYKFIDKIRPQHYAFPFSCDLELCDIVRDKIANIFSELLANSIYKDMDSLTSDKEGTIEVDINTGGSLLSYFIECLEQEYKRLNPKDMHRKYKRAKNWHRKCKNILGIEAAITPVFSMVESLISEFSKAIDLVNEGITTGIPEKMKCGASLLATCSEEFYMIYYSLVEVKAPRHLLPLFKALGSAILTPGQEIFQLLNDLKTEYEHALSKLRKNPEQTPCINYQLVLTIGNEEEFYRELKKIESSIS